MECRNILTDRVVVVTGASSGIGRASAERFARAGARVACCGRNRERLEAARAGLTGGGHAVYLFDSADLADVERMISDIVRDMGAVGGVLHSAGISLVSPLRSMDFAGVDRMFRLNYTVFMAMAKAVCRKGRSAPDASVVAVSSLASISPDPAMSAYAASKAALDASVRSLAREYASRGIRFNTIAPSYVDTPMSAEMRSLVGDAEFEAKVAANMPLGMILPEDVAESALFLLSPASRRITGITLVMNAGGGSF